MSRVPIRVRVAAAFAVAMAIVLAATGLFVYARLGDDLARALDQDLRLRGQDLSALVREPDRTLAAESHGRLIERGESFAQLLTPRGQVVDATPPLGGRPLLGVPDLRAALRRPRFVDRPSVPGLDEPARLLALAVQRGGVRRVLVVGATRENRAEALRSLRTELLIAGPIALGLATLLGYLLAGAGLRAVEAMRRRAAEISADRPGERLPVPTTGDELQRLGATLNAMLTRLETALERERGFVAEAGHELRTPLALLRASSTSPCTTPTARPSSATRCGPRARRPTGSCNSPATSCSSRARRAASCRSAPNRSGPRPPGERAQPLCLARGGGRPGTGRSGGRTTS